MRAPEEIKKGLECCYGNTERRLCEKCPNGVMVEGYSEIMCTDFDSLGEDALALIEQLEKREWELFSLLSSAYHGKQYYFKQSDDTAYSKATCEYMSFDQAVDEFAKTLTYIGEAQSGTDANVPTITGETSDGYHTFNELYHHRAVLFSVIVKAFPDKAWKSRLHSDGSMFDGMFIVGIDTPDGPATYHYDIEPYWDMFRCIELERAPEWDGHTAEQAINRIMKLEPARHGRWIKHKAYVKTAKCSECKTDFTKIVISDKYPNYCPNCGAKMDGDSHG